MNPRDIFSIRVKNQHIDAGSNPDNPSIKDFESINKAKAHSRKLGGAAHVKACKTMKEAKAFMKLRREYPYA